MSGIHDIEVVVFDVLGTLVDEPSGLRAAIREAVPAAGDELLAVWQEHIETEQARIGRGERAYAGSEVLDAEAAQLVAGRAGITDPAVIARLATAGQRHPAWPDSVAGLDQLSRRFPVLALSNAGHAALLRLDAHAGLRWHQALSSADVRVHKPAPAIYRHAIDVAGCAPDRVLMVAAHAWDLRGAQAVGMRTAYVHRPVGDPPAESDSFDLRVDGLDGLVTALSRPPA
ncbi:haloacid dehalogenase type II [Amycolatopsis sp. ATCC 39116]|uniref:haloacid dehalogenase type II n=1 Tax=Amycolatopsis sp. (strain ATCC 39116 / 75iv2) TaxID=385957 RepID=UPI00026255AD|nr:haloacid dehalogenase type II [Amycolatopsis sp. ATCC 39116]